MKKWFWAVGLLIVGALLGGKAAVVSDTRLIKYMTIGGVLGFAIGSLLDWQEKKAEARIWDRVVNHEVVLL